MVASIAMTNDVNWRQLLEPDVQEYMTRNKDADVRVLALQKPVHESWNMPMILDQIKVRQKSKIKSVNFYETDGFIFPDSDVFEQASSQACANYKSSLVDEGESFVDLTGGSGIDAFTFAQRFESVICIERDEKSAELLAHNAETLRTCGFFSSLFGVVHGEAEDFVAAMDPVDFVYIDPQRRENSKKGLYDFTLCSPNICELVQDLSKKARRVMVKASPMLDIEQGILALRNVVQVHVVQWAGECKELLFVLDFTQQRNSDDVEIIAVDLDDDGAVKKEFSFTFAEEEKSEPDFALPEVYVYEPYPAFQKSGAFKSMAVQYGVKKLHPNTHLYTSDELIEGFPGRVHKIDKVVGVKDSSVKGMKGELALRNFPGNVDVLRKKLKISEGGDYRIYAATLFDERKMLILCIK